MVARKNRKSDADVGGELKCGFSGRNGKILKKELLALKSSFMTSSRIKNSQYA